MYVYSHVVYNDQTCILVQARASLREQCVHNQTWKWYSRAGENTMFKRKRDVLLVNICYWRANICYVRIIIICYVMVCYGMLTALCNNRCYVMTCYIVAGCYVNCVLGYDNICYANMLPIYYRVHFYNINNI